MGTCTIYKKDMVDGYIGFSELKQLLVKRGAPFVFEDGSYKLEEGIQIGFVRTEQGDRIYTWVKKHDPSALEAIIAMANKRLDSGADYTEDDVFLLEMLEMLEKVKTDDDVEDFVERNFS